MLDLSTVAAARAAWSAALRSGTYAQCTGQLRDAKGFCCLGVAGDLCAQAGKAEWASPDNDNEGLLVDYGEALPPALAEIFGIVDTQMEYTTANDERGRTFQEIADYIDGYITVEQLLTESDSCGSSLP